MYKKSLGLLAALYCLSSSPLASGAQLQWLSKKTVLVDGVFEITKPGGDWDTLEIPDYNQPVKWVLHRVGSNPEMVLRYDTLPSGKKQKKDYISIVRSDLERRGINVDHVESRFINGRDVFLLHGMDRLSQMQYLVAVYRNNYRAFWLECLARPSDFNKFSTKFMDAIQSVRLARDL